MPSRSSAVARASRCKRECTFSFPNKITTFSWNRCFLHENPHVKSGYPQAAPLCYAVFASDGAVISGQHCNAMRISTFITTFNTTGPIGIRVEVYTKPRQLPLPMPRIGWHRRDHWLSGK
ncbi:hypothetical protein K491DRAFT_304059 [Lophiostoma macrostomum CBS 122681]|uniref:Uncharacterized protein n=1 Tax=Lophiostoma macrostomum CBS 122681 TaxID=1314788 RepID=A0A6A6SIB7_9PLEO|nr:hypothetical protein K491DRAFT_304059 [Lophiostoma macrostomum CBS 122681]